jgi:molecular chaperone IbpA
MIHMVIFNEPFIGNLAQEFEKVFTQPVKATYPPYNVIRNTEDDSLILEFAVAGFAKKEIDITVDKGTLHIDGVLENGLEPGLEYVHKGIATRRFSRSFNLPEYYEVNSASVNNGILYINLVKNVPEEKKPKSIKID